MKFTKFIASSIASIALLAGSANAAVLKMGTGGPDGSYFSMGNDIVSYCQDELSQDTIEVGTSTGSVENLVGLRSKKFALSIVQEDVLQFHAKRTPNKVNKNSLKIITPMHVESMHLLIPKGYKPEGKKSGWFGNLFSDDKPVSVDINLLKGQTIAAWGGSSVSAKALSYFFGLNANVVDIEPGSLVNKPIIVVAGYPSATVEKYLATKKYNLVSIDYNTVNQNPRAEFYTNEVLNYTINGKMQSVPTIGVRALLIGKSFRKASRNITASELSTCIDAYLADLADDPSTNPNWLSVYDFVDTGDQVSWDYFPLLNQ